MSSPLNENRRRCRSMKPHAFRASDHDPVLIGLSLVDPMARQGKAWRPTSTELLPTGDKNTDKRLNKAIDRHRGQLEFKVVDERTDDQQQEGVRQ